MSIQVKTVKEKKGLDTFIKLPFQIYKGNKQWIPQLIIDDRELFNPKKNPAFENADTKLFIAYQNENPVGRVAGILSHIANAKYKTKNMRFGWFECIDDADVAGALFKAVEDWGRQTGMKTITGPQGFTDLDPEGMLVEGFDKLPTIASNFNHPYYQKLVEGCGFEKEIDYLEFRAMVPKKGEFPEKLSRIVEKLRERSNMRVLEFKNKKELTKRAEELFYLLDEAFEEIYGSVPLTAKQVKYYVKNNHQYKSNSPKKVNLPHPA